MRSTAIFCLFLAMTLGLSAQTACIEGSVVDTTGAPVRIPVIAFNSGRVVSMTTSNPDGHFRISINATPAREYDLITSDDFKGYSPRATPNMASAVKVAMIGRPELMDTEKFEVTVASNRGLSGNVFDSEQEALAWLLDPNTR